MAEVAVDRKVKVMAARTFSPVAPSDDAEQNGSVDRPAGRRSGWAWVVRVAAFVVAVFVLFHAVGGWYFAGVLHHDALDAQARRAHLEPGYGVEVLAVEAGALTLTDTDATARRPGVWGVAWPHGYGLISGTPSMSDTPVTWDFEHLDGLPVEPGDFVEVHERAIPDDPTVMFGVDPEVVAVEGPLGEYESWFYPGTRSTWVLVMHGNGLDRLDLAKLVPAVRSGGYPVLFVTMRNDPGAPEDPSGMLRYGDTEWEDLDAAVGFAIAEGAEGVILIAPSMGGGVALTFLERSGQADAVRGLVLDSPLVDFGRAVDAKAADEKIPVIGLPVPGTLVGAAKWFATRRFGVDWDSTGHLDETDRINVPVLVFHGTDDDDVPIETSRELAAARPELVTLVEVVGAPHLGSWNIDPVAYETILIPFLDRLMG